MTPLLDFTDANFERVARTVSHVLSCQNEQKYDVHVLHGMVSEMTAGLYAVCERANDEKYARFIRKIVKHHGALLVANSPASLGPHAVRLAAVGNLDMLLVVLGFLCSSSFVDQSELDATLHHFVPRILRTACVHKHHDVVVYIRSHFAQHADDVACCDDVHRHYGDPAHAHTHECQSSLYVSLQNFLDTKRAHTPDMWTRADVHLVRTLVNNPRFAHDACAALPAPGS